MTIKRFVEWEKDFIRLAYPTTKANEIAMFLGRTTGAILAYVSRHGLSSPGKVSPQNVGLTPHERRIQNDKRARDKKRSLGKCCDCPALATKGVFCVSCSRKRNSKHTVERMQLRKNSVCIDCREPFKNGKGGRCITCYESQRISHKRDANKLKDDVFMAYGGYRCNCCGETQPEFLAIDHIDGNGAAHRREVAKTNDKLKAQSTNIYRWLRTNGFPIGFQVLCHNCNMGKHLNGNVCPHKTQLSDVSWLWSLSKQKEPGDTARLSM